MGAAVAAALLTHPLLSAGAAAPPEPSYGTAQVDGDPSEWSGGDVFGSLLSNDAPYAALATASLRYDCDSSLLYVLVSANAGVVLQAIDPAEDYVRLSTGKLVTGLSGNDGTAPDFAWIGLNGDTATGWEASAQVEEGAYPAQLRIHAKVPDDSGDGYEVIDLTPRYSDLTLLCTEIEPASSTSTPSTSSSTTPTESTTTVPGEEPVVKAEAVEAPAADPVSAEAEFTG